MKKYYKYIYALIVITLFWYLGYLYVSRPIVPSPFVVVPTFFSIFRSKLLIHSIYSIRRLLYAIIIAVLIGWPLGMVCGYYKKIDNVISPIIYFIYPIPKIAFLPVVMLLYGLGELSKIITLVMVIVFQIFVTMQDYVSSIDESKYYPMRALDASDVQVFYYIIIPSSIKRLLHSIKIALATSISVLFFAETYGTIYGLGFFIMDSMVRVNYIEMYCGIIALSFIGVFLFAIIEYISSLLEY